MKSKQVLFIIFVITVCLFTHSTPGFTKESSVLQAFKEAIEFLEQYPEYHEEVELLKKFKAGKDGYKINLEFDQFIYAAVAPRIFGKGAELTITTFNDNFEKLPVKNRASNLIHEMRHVIDYDKMGYNKSGALNQRNWVEDNIANDGAIRAQTEGNAYFGEHESMRRFGIRYNPVPETDPEKEKLRRRSNDYVVSSNSGASKYMFSAKDLFDGSGMYYDDEIGAWISRSNNMNPHVIREEIEKKNLE